MPQTLEASHVRTRPGASPAHPSAPHSQAVLHRRMLLGALRGPSMCAHSLPQGCSGPGCTSRTLVRDHRCGTCYFTLFATPDLILPPSDVLCEGQAPSMSEPPTQTFTGEPRA